MSRSCFAVGQQLPTPERMAEKRFPYMYLATEHHSGSIKKCVAGRGRSDTRQMLPGKAEAVLRAPVWAICSRRAPVLGVIRAARRENRRYRRLGRLSSIGDHLRS